MILVSLTDFFATFAEMADYETGQEIGEDSFSLWPVLHGKTDEPVRTSMIHHSSGGMYGIRNGEWKYIDGLGSGGFTHPTRTEPQPGGPQGQLYNISVDSLESKNLYMDHPEIVSALKKSLETGKSFSTE